jgi:hypothetical protein
MFASPLRPRTMTKEWQEASEEYLQVRIFRLILPHISPLTRNRPRDQSPSPATRECWYRASLRRTCLLNQRPTSKETDSKKHRAHTLCHLSMPIPLFLASAFPFGTLPSVTYNIYNKIGRGLPRTDAQPESIGYSYHCHISPPLYRNLRGTRVRSAFPFARSPLRSTLLDDV